MHDKFKHTADGYQTEDSTTSLPSLCQICDHPGANRTCANNPCTQIAHAACCQQNWTCRECTHPAPLPVLPPAIVTALLASPLTYTASDGSVRNQDTHLSSSTYGFHISHTTHPFTHQGHISVLPFEASSLRAELEGIIAAYHLIPAEGNNVHTVDNETAIVLHNSSYTGDSQITISPSNHTEPPSYTYPTSLHHEAHPFP